MIIYKSLSQITSDDISRIESPVFMANDSKSNLLKSGRLFALETNQANKPLFEGGQLSNISQVFLSFELRRAIEELEALIPANNSGSFNAVRQEIEEDEDEEEEAPPAKKEKVQHRIQLEIEPDEDASLPESHDINLVVINSSNNAVAFKQKREVIRQQDSRVFKLEEGERFEVFALLKEDDKSHEDLKNNGNLDESKQAERVIALELTSEGEGANGVNMHYAKYIVPDHKEFVFSC